MEKTSLSDAICATLAYADIFHYPLKEKELFGRLIFSREGKKKFREELKRLVKEGRVKNESGYFLFPGREKVIAQREKGEAVCREKLPLAKRAAIFLGKIPFVYLVGLTGNLAVGTTKADDDIDFLIITAPGTLWLTRFLIYLYLRIFGKRENLFVRRPGEKETRNRLCLNLFLDANHLGVKKERQNLFTAYEVILMKSLFVKKGADKKFLAANSWAKEYFAHHFFSSEKFFPLAFFSPASFVSFFSSINLLSPLNWVCFLGQKLYMRGKPRVKEVGLTQAFFHPRDLSAVTLKKWRKKVLQTCPGFPLDKKGGNTYN